MPKRNLGEPSFVPLPSRPPSRKAVLATRMQLAGYAPEEIARAVRELKERIAAEENQEKKGGAPRE